MSYLNALRVHFAGGFETAPSTVNNDINHYDNAAFTPNLQLPGPGTTNGWWNPEGDHRFKFNAGVTTAHHGDGTAAAASDPVLTLRVFDQSIFPAKMVDLDPDQQLVSMIFGLEVAVGPAGGAPLLKGTFAPAPFTDIFIRGNTGGGDERAAAMYQSVIESLQWGDVSNSRFLTELRAAAADGALSIKFNLDGYSMARGTPGFTKGRLVGTIGPAAAGEPRRFVRGRHFDVENLNPNGLFVVPRHGVNFCAGFLDEVGRKVWLDLGNALPTTPSRGPIRDIGVLTLECVVSGGPPLPLGAIVYTAANWYEQTAGVVALPAGRGLTDAELAAVRDNPLALRLTPPVGPQVIAAAEAADGKHLRADLFVARLNPGDVFAAEFYASRFGRPLAGAMVGLSHTGVPAGGLTLPAAAPTDAAGRASVPLRGADPGNPRVVIDGQVYYVDQTLDGAGMTNPSDFLSVLVWDAFTPDAPPTWHGSMKPIFQQYANLYPMMKGFVDLGDYDDVSANRGSLIATLSLPQTNSHYMPVTRDLSEAKRLAMIQWLTNVGADGKPLLGTAPPAPPVPGPAVAVAAAAPGGAADGEPVGSKEVAAEALVRKRAPLRKR